MKVVVSRRAEDDLLRTFSYLDERNKPAAQNFIADINRKFEQLARFPFIGRERTTLRHGLRSVVVGTHLILYLVREADIVIVRMIDGRMDIDEEFQK